MSEELPGSHGNPPPTGSIYEAVKRMEKRSSGEVAHRNQSALKKAFIKTDDHVMEPSASGVFCSRILNMVNSEDVNAIILAQRHMLDRFEKTNEMLLNFNSLSNTRLQQMNDRFMHHTRTLVEMKKDLDIIFRRIRMLKGKLAKQYPESFNNVHESPILEDDDDFDPTPKSAATTIATSEQSTESCDTSPSIISPTMSQDFEDLSQAPSETPSANGQLLTDDEVAQED